MVNKMQIFKIFAEVIVAFHIFYFFGMYFVLCILLIMDTKSTHVEGIFFIFKRGIFKCIFSKLEVPVFMICHKSQRSLRKVLLECNHTACQAHRHV